MNTKISIIIPVYNVADYLKQALDSLISQTYTNWEAICIDDGSIDNSLEILEEYAQRDSRFIIIKQQNSGVSSARNAGLKIAAGEYIMFLDADDFLKKNACESALKNIEQNKSDVAIFGYDDLFNDKLIPNYRNKIIKDIVSGIKEPEFSIFVTVWMKIFKKNFLIEKNISFMEAQDVSEDMLFSYFVLFSGAKVSLIDESLYVYRRNRENSLTTKNINGIKSEIKAAKLMIQNPLFKEVSITLQKYFIQECFRNCFYYYGKFKTLQEHLILYCDILKMLHFWESKYDKNILTTIEEYRQLKVFYKCILKEFLPQKVYSDDFYTYLKEIKFEKTLKSIKRKIKNESVIIYGTGMFYQYIAENYNLTELNIIGISDMKFAENQEGNIFLDYQIIPKSKIKEYNPAYVLIAAKNYESILEDFKLNLLVNTKIKVIPLAKKS